MPATLYQIVQLAGAMTAFVAALLLFFGSLSVPSEMESWKGQTAPELRWKRRRRLLVWVGIPSATISFVCQVAVVLFPPT